MYTLYKCILQLHVVRLVATECTLNEFIMDTCTLTGCKQYATLYHCLCCLQEFDTTAAFFTAAINKKKKKAPGGQTDTHPPGRQKAADSRTSDDTVSFTFTSSAATYSMCLHFVCLLHRHFPIVTISVQPSPPIYCTPVTRDIASENAEYDANWYIN